MTLSRPPLPRHLRPLGLSALLCLGTTACVQAQPTPGAAPSTTYPIRYKLDSPGQVSLAIYNREGHLVRTLLAIESQTAGEQTIQWDGKDESGAEVPSPADCTWKLLQTNGLKAHYLMTLGPTFPQGKASWEVGLGNHDGPRSVAIDDSGIYVGSGVGENVRNGIKMNLAGTDCIWSSWAPQQWQGRMAMSVMDGQIYFLQQNGRVVVQPKDKPNGHHKAIGKGAAGIIWDALWPETKAEDTNLWGDAAINQSKDIVAYNSGNNPQLVISYLHQNAVQWRNPADGAVLATVENIPNPRGVTIDNDGRVLVISDNNVLGVGRDGSKTTLVTGLTTPHRIDVDRSPAAGRGDILVSELGTSQQVKRFSPTGQLKATYGALGGRSHGLYVAGNFRDVVDLSSDNAGGFFVVENSVPRRVARFDNAGKLIKEWYGGMHWVPYVSSDPGDRRAMWMSYNGDELLRAIVDIDKKTWRIHSTYNFNGLADGMIRPHFGGNNQGLGGGYGAWQVRRRPGSDITYLVRRNHLQIVRVDERDWTLKPLVVGNFSDANKKAAFLWTDANGDGKPQETEYQRFKWGEWGFNRLFLTSPFGFDYFRFWMAQNKIVRQKVVGWNSIGAPLYAPFDKVEEFATLPSRPGFGSTYGNPPALFARETEQSPLFMAFNGSPSESTPWGNAAFNKMYKFDNTGQLQWQAGQHLNRPPGHHAYPPAGKVISFKAAVGVTHGVVVATDFNGGWEGSIPSITYAWDNDGLFVGGLFTNPNLDLAPLWQYSQATDNGVGEMVTDPKTGDVTYLGTGENDIRLYKITGWNGWKRQSGKVSAP